MVRYCIYFGTDFDAKIFVELLSTVGTSLISGSSFGSVVFVFTDSPLIHSVEDNEVRYCKYLGTDFDEVCVAVAAEIGSVSADATFSLARSDIVDSAMSSVIFVDDKAVRYCWYFGTEVDDRLLAVSVWIRLTTLGATRWLVRSGFIDDATSS